MFLFTLRGACRDRNSRRIRIGRIFNCRNGARLIGRRRIRSCALASLVVTHSVKMNRALLVERVNQRDCNRQTQESNSAENIGSKHHARQRNERMQPNAIANDLWLHDLANDDDHHVEDSKPDARRQIAGDQRQYRPGQQNKPAANNGENIEYCDRDGVFSLAPGNILAVSCAKPETVKISIRIEKSSLLMMLV